MKVVTVGGKMYEIDGLPHGGTLPMWQLLRQNGQPMMPQMFDQLSDAEKRELHTHVQQYIRETAAYQGAVAARSAALSRGEKLPDEEPGLLTGEPPLPPAREVPSTFGFGEAGDRAGFGQGPFADFIGRDTPTTFARAPHLFSLANDVPAEPEGRATPIDRGIWRPSLFGLSNGAGETSSGVENYAALAILAFSLERMAREEIDRIDGERPNDLVDKT
jgi:hypothetical protein